jgi:hypothetical protein
MIPAVELAQQAGKAMRPEVTIAREFFNSRSMARNQNRSKYKSTVSEEQPSACSSGRANSRAFGKFAAFFSKGHWRFHADAKAFYGRDGAGRCCHFDKDHLVASVRDGSRWIILDNRTMSLLGSQEEPDYVPLLEFDRDGVRRFSERCRPAL